METTGQLFQLFSFLPFPADIQNDGETQPFERKWWDGGRERREGAEWRQGIDRENQGVPWRFTDFRARQPGAEF